MTCKSLCDSRLTVFRVVKMSTLKMVNSLLLSDLLVACPEAGQRCGAYGSGMQGEKIPEPYYEIRPGGVAIVFRFEDINNESNSNQNCELDCELDCELKLTDRQKVILYILMSDGEKTAS